MTEAAAPTPAQLLAVLKSGMLLMARTDSPEGSDVIGLQVNRYAPDEIIPACGLYEAEDLPLPLREKTFPLSAEGVASAWVALEKGLAMWGVTIDGQQTGLGLTLDDLKELGGKLGYRVERCRESEVSMLYDWYHETFDEACDHSYESEEAAWRAVGRVLEEHMAEALELTTPADGHETVDYEALEARLFAPSSTVKALILELLADQPAPDSAPAAG